MHSKRPCFLLFFFCTFAIFGQNIQISKISEAQGGEYVFNKNDQACVSPVLRQKIDSVIGLAVKKFGTIHGKQPMTTFFEWPVQKAASCPYFEIWAISNYVDHNAGFPNQTTDYNCGFRTYDTSNGYNHQGVDIFTWPFSWDQFYNNQAEVIAAAPGTIVFKDDGNFDQSCAFNNNDWNAIYVQHADGSLALYGHMKSNTLTTKGVGDIVQTGDFLGVVGSSGNSTGPHLHFEVFDSAGNLIDPYVGSCNNLNSTSWWNNQKNYREPNINAVLTQGSPPIFKACPQPATINAESNFQFGDNIYVAAYFRDQIVGTQANFKLKGPGGNVLNSWSKVFQDTYSASYWYYSFSFQGSGSQTTLDLTFEVTYEGETRSTAFQVGNLGTDTFAHSDFEVFPNPFNEKINISGKKILKSVSIYDIGGKLILKEKPNAMKTSLQTGYLETGVYFLKMTGENGAETVKKMLKI